MRTAMEPRRAREIAERLHAADVDESGAPVLWHLRRVARSTPPEARAVAWLHEAFESTPVSEQELLEGGLTNDELRALRLLRTARPTRAARARTWRMSTGSCARPAAPASSRAWSRSRISRIGACILASGRTAGRRRTGSASGCCSRCPTIGAARPARTKWQRGAALRVRGLG